ncbi:hypothetical protein C8Q80DRAFT_1123454 [Daedaleopsis nitida]|nr:hypothetical protein C8Q80DRAFT_1123454 [Daedaleopsis nitida]
MTTLATLSAVAVACAVAVQGASIVNVNGSLNATLAARGCSLQDSTTSKCETSGGSPLIFYGTCQLDVCGPIKAQIADGVNCGGYFQTILNECQHDGRVGGLLIPETCNVDFSHAMSSTRAYKLEITHV